MKKACEPQKDSKETIRKLRDPKLSSRHFGDLNGKNHKNLTINIQKRNDGEMSGAELELEKLQAQVEERDKEIAALRQAAKVKDRKLDQLNNRCRKEQLRQYYRFMELEPVVELEEDSGGGDESPTSSGPPSLSPPPYMADIWAEDSLYSGLLREHLELQRSHHALELRLKRSEARARQLHELRRTASEQLQQLQAEALELRELNELLEFRILELEEAHDPESMAHSPGPDTRDVCTDTENDDISDSGVVSLPTSEEVGSDTDLGVHDLKIDLPHEELRERILLLARSSSCDEEKCCAKQVVSLLEEYSPLSPLASPDLLMARSFKNLSESNSTAADLPKTSGRIIATVLPFNELTHPPSPTELYKDNIVKHPYNCLTKQTKSTDSLQESGIFESEAMDVVCKSTQTDGAALSGDLSAEIQKLTQFRERIEEERAGMLAGSELAFCRERLRLMEDKVRVYESSGDQQASLLAERLQRELELTAQLKEMADKVTRLQSEISRLEEERCVLENKVRAYENSGDDQASRLAVRLKEMTEKISRLQSENSRLEEERCELEEAENDTRLRCQKLEAKLQALCDKKSELQTKLQQERRANGHLKTELEESEKWQLEARSLETVVSKYEQRNYELEERQVELSHKLEMLEGYWPAVLLWVAWRTLGASVSTFRTPCAIKQQPEYFPDKLRELELDEAIGERQEAEGMSNASDTEYRFELQERSGMDVIDMQRIKEIEEGYLQRIQELEEELNSFKEQRRDSSTTAVPEHINSRNCLLVSAPARTVNECKNSECKNRLQELSLVERELKKRVLELEQKEAAYMVACVSSRTIEECESNHCIKRLQELTDVEKELRKKISLLEQKEPVHLETNSKDCLLVKCVPARTFDEECKDSECRKRVYELTQAEIELRTRISELEQKEAAYMETLQQADDLWSELENDYQKQIQELRASEVELQGRLEAAEGKLRETSQEFEARVSELKAGEAELQGRLEVAEGRLRLTSQELESRVTELEQVLAESKRALQRKEEDRASLAAKVASLTETLLATEGNLEALRREVDDVLRPQLAEEQRRVTQLRQEFADKGRAMEALQDSHDSEIKLLKNELSAVKKECMHANCECDQLKAEVQTLEKTILDQRECIQEQKEHNEKTFITLTTLLEAKDRELEAALVAARDAQVRSARDELEEALQAAPVQPPPRTKRGNFWRRASLQEGRDPQHITRVMDCASSHSKECSKCSEPIDTAIQAIFSHVRTLSELFNGGHLQQSSQTEAKCQKEVKEDQIAHTLSTVGLKTDEADAKTKDEDCKKPTWLTEVSININESSQPVSSDVKRSIIYWDDLSSQTKASSRKAMNRRSRLQALGRSVDGDIVESPTI